MLRGERLKEIEKKPEHGILINKVFTLLRRKVYFNFELRWDKEKD